MVKHAGILHQLQPVDVLLIGDFMLDRYTTGKVRRISPEAPVPILHVQKEESRPGGAGNVALNIVSLGARARVVGRLGHDAAGEQLCDDLMREGIQVQGLMFQKGYTTPVKNRLIADAQQVLRVDFETLSPLPMESEARAIDCICSHMRSVAIVAISDYGKGFLSRSLLQATIAAARERNLPVIVDPKGDDFSKYAGATILKPNLAEAYAAAKALQETSLDVVAQNILRTTQVEMIMITKSEAGMSLHLRDGTRFDFPVRSREVKDVTGAGDTVLAMVSVALANGLPIRTAAQLGNLAAGIAVERIGCARISLAEIADRLVEDDLDFVEERGAPHLSLESVRSGSIQ